MVDFYTAALRLWFAYIFTLMWYTPKGNWIALAWLLVLIIWRTMQ